MTTYVQHLADCLIAFCAGGLLACFTNWIETRNRTKE